MSGDGVGGGGLDAYTASVMRHRVGAIEEEVRASVELEGGTCFGMDFVIAARRPPLPPPLPPPPPPPTTPPPPPTTTTTERW